MVAAGFSGGEAEDLRRAMGFKRSAERMDKLEAKLRSGMEERGIVGEGQEQIVQAITSFALYGFPESHAASFALIAYASAYLKAHHPTVFLISLLNAWPMGFYYPATLVKDAQRHGVDVRTIDVNYSGWKCRFEAAGQRRAQRPAASNVGHSAPIAGAGLAPAWEGTRPFEAAGLRAGRLGPVAEAGRRRRGRCPKVPKPQGAARLGLRFVKGLRKGAGEAIEREQALHPFADADDLARRCHLRGEELEVLAEIGALGSLGLTRRGALWQVAQAARPAGSLFHHDVGAGLVPAREGTRPSFEAAGLRAGRHSETTNPLPEMSAYEETLADYAGAGMTTGPHPLEHLRAGLDRHGIVPAANSPATAMGIRFVPPDR